MVLREVADTCRVVVMARVMTELQIIPCTPDGRPPLRESCLWGSFCLQRCAVLEQLAAGRISRTGTWGTGLLLQEWNASLDSANVGARESCRGDEKRLQ